MTIYQYIEHHAAQSPTRLAVVSPQERCTYGQLHERILQRADSLAHCYSPGQVVCLRAQPTVDFLVSYYAIHRAGLVAAPLGSTIPDAAFSAAESRLASCSVPPGTADILFTTGTTGRSKGVIVSHRAMVANAENLVSGQGYTSDLAFVASGPLNHLGTLSKAYTVFMTGATLVIVDGLKDINCFFSALDFPDASRTATFLVPASIRMLLLWGADRLAALEHKIDFIETGAAAISPADMAALCRLLPHTRLYNTYASTETGIVCTYNFNDGRCLAGCVGRPMLHSLVAVTPQGFIACSGDTLMTGYAGDPEATSAILKDGMLYTADIGRMDADGMLYLQGRAGDIINVGGYKVDPVEVEQAALSFPGVQDCVCIAVEHPVAGRALKLLLVMQPGQELQRRLLARHLLSCLEDYKVPQLYELTDRVERTFNGKIDRRRYGGG